MISLLPLFYLSSIIGESIELNYYWLANESSYITTSSKTYPIPKCTNTTSRETLFHTSPEFAHDLIYQGSGKLSNGTIVNCMNDACDCFNFVPYALGSGGKLSKFTSITLNKYSKGIKIFVPKLKGYRLPGGSVHNGCLRVDDTCFDCDESRIKLYVEDIENSKVLKRDLPNIVDIEPYSSCDPLTY